MNTPAASAPSLPDQLTLRRARAEIIMGHFNEMRAVLEPFSTSENDLAKTLYAYCLAGIGQPEEAAEILCDIASRHAGTEHPLQALSDLMAELNKRPLAEATCRAALKRTPQDARIYEILGNLLVQYGQFDEAISLLHQAITLRPNSMHSHNLLAMALLEKGCFDEAWHICKVFWKRSQIMPARSPTSDVYWQEKGGWMKHWITTAGLSPSALQNRKSA